MRLDLSCPALRATLHTCDPHDAALWLYDVMGSCPVGAQIAVCLDGVNHGSRIVSRLMCLSEQSLETALRAEMATVRETLTLRAA